MYHLLNNAWLSAKQAYETGALSQDDIVLFFEQQVLPNTLQASFIRQQLIHTYQGTLPEAVILKWQWLDGRAETWHTDYMQLYAHLEQHHWRDIVIQPLSWQHWAHHLPDTDRWLLLERIAHALARWAPQTPVFIFLQAMNVLFSKTSAQQRFVAIQHVLSFQRWRETWPAQAGHWSRQIRRDNTLLCSPMGHIWLDYLTRPQQRQIVWRLWQHVEQHLDTFSLSTIIPLYQCCQHYDVVKMSRVKQRLMAQWHLLPHRPSAVRYRLLKRALVMGQDTRVHHTLQRWLWQLPTIMLATTHRKRTSTLRWLLRSALELGSPTQQALAAQALQLWWVGQKKQQARGLLVWVSKLHHGHWYDKYTALLKSLPRWSVQHGNHLEQHARQWFMHAGYDTRHREAHAQWPDCFESLPEEAKQQLPWLWVMSILHQSHAYQLKQSLPMSVMMANWRSLSEQAKYWADQVELNPRAWLTQWQKNHRQVQLHHLKIQAVLGNDKQKRLKKQSETV